MITLSRMFFTGLLGLALVFLPGCSEKKSGDSPTAAVLSTNSLSVPAGLSATMPAAGVTAPVTSGARLATPQEVALVPDGTQLISAESGKAIQKNASTPALVYEGRLYFLCCEVCRQKCVANPKLLLDAKPPNGYELQKLGKPEA